MGRTGGRMEGGGAGAKELMQLERRQNSDGYAGASE